MSKGAALRLTADGMRATRPPHGVHVNTAARQASGISAYSEGGRTRAEPLPVLSMAWLPRDLVVESRGSKSMR